mmetsp:Transcript_65264/g.105481  ORF Transcript_65264/g.105481 Transcript_65264/m.105481 type:complete len:95 (-) Transcript_65264:322-606(-)
MASFPGRRRRRFGGLAVAAAAAGALGVGVPIAFTGVTNQALHQETARRWAAASAAGETGILGSSCSGDGSIEVLRPSSDSSRGVVRIFFEVCGG